MAGLLAAAGWLGSSPLAPAANTPDTYTGAATGDISTPGNWSLTTVPTVTNDAVFSGSTVYSGLTDTSANVVFGSLDDTDTGAVTLTIATGRTLTLGGAGDLGNSVSGAAAADLLYVGSTSTMTIGAGGTGGIVLSTAAGGGNGNFDIAGTATISAPISGSAGFVMTGGGTLTLSGVNTFSGGLTAAQGTVVLGIANATTVSGAAGPSADAITLGSSTGGTAALLTGGTVTISNAINLGASAAGTLTIGASNGSVGTFSGAIGLNGDNLTIGGAGTGVTTISGGITGTGNLAVTNASSGAVTLSTTAVNNAGTITDNGTGTGALTISAPVGTNVTSILDSSSAALTISGALTVNSGGTTLTNGSSANVAFNVTGAISGTGNLILNDNNSNATPGAITLSSGVNNVGTITNSGTKTGAVTISGVIGSNVTGVTQNSATSTLTLSGFNTYTGGTTISGGTLTVGTTGVVGLTSGLATIPGISGALGLNSAISLANVAGATLNLAGNLLQIGSLTGGGTTGGNVVLGSGTLVTGGDNTSPAAYAGIISGTGALIKIGSGTQILSGANTYSGLTSIFGGTLQIGTGSATGSLSTGNVVDNASLVFNRTGTLAQGTNFGTISGSGSLSLTGGATMTLSSANSYTGATSILGGTLTAGVISVPGVSGALGLNSAVTLAATGATLNLNNFATQIGSLTGGSATDGNVLLGSATLTTGGDNSSPAAYAGVISGAGGLTKIGTGTQTLTGTNTYTGTTTVNGGTLSLDFTGTTAPATNIIASGHPLVLGGGALNLIGNATAADSETFATTTFNAGGSAAILSAGSSGTNLLALGTLTRNTGGTVNFTLPAGTQSSTNGITTSTSTLANNVLATTTNGTAYATVGGTDWATVSSGNIVGYSSLFSYTETSVAGTTPGSYTSTNTDVNASAAPTAPITPNTLRFNTAAANTLTLATGANIVGAGGILVTGNAGSNTQTITGGTLEGSNAGQELVIIQNDTAGGLTISSAIANNSTASTLTKSGAGLLTLSNTANSYSGGTFLDAGILNVAADGSLGAAAALAVNGGTLQLAGSFNFVSGRGMTLGASGGTIDTNGFATTYAGVIGGAGGLTKVGSGTLTLSAVNTFTGSTIFDAGVVNISSEGNTTTPVGGNLGAVPTTATPTALVFNGGTLQATAALNLNANRGVTLLSGGATLADASSGVFGIAGAVTGSGNLVLNSNNATTVGNGIEFLSGGSINNAGKITNNGTGTAYSLIFNTPLGANVTNVTQNSLTSALLISGPSQSYTGSTNVLAGTLELAGSSGGTFNAVGITGTVTLGDVSGNASASIVALSSQVIYNPLVVGAGTSANTLTLGGFGLMYLNGGLTLANNLFVTPASGAVTETGAVSGTGNVTLVSANFSGATNITLGGSTNFTGTLTDASVGTGNVLLSGPVGANVSSITQNSAASSRLYLSVANPGFGGNIYLQSGTLDIDNAQALGNNGGSASGAGTLVINGGLLSANVFNNNNGAITISSVNPESWNGNFSYGVPLVGSALTAAGLSTGTGAITLGANVQVTDLVPANFNPGGAIGGTGNLTLLEDYTGGFTLAGLVNNTGTLSTAGAGTGAIAFTTGIGGNVSNFTQGSNGITTFSTTEAYTGATNISAGTLAVNFTAASGTNLIPGGSNLAIGGGGTLTVLGKTGFNDSQTFASTAFSAGNSTLAITAASGTQTVVLNLNGITRSVGGTAVFGQPTVDTTISATNGYLTSTQNTNGILGGWATVGNEFATNNTAAAGTGNIVALNTASGYTLFPATGAVAATNYKLGSTTTTGATVTTTGDSAINSLNLQTSTATGDTINNSGTITDASGGLLASESTASTSATHSILGGFLTSTNAQNDLIATVNNAATAGTTSLKISSVIEDATPGMSLTKSGAGTLTLTGVNTYTGATYLNGGILNVAADSGLGTAPTAVTANDLDIAGGTLQAGGSLTLSATRGLTLATAGGTIDTNAFNVAYAGVIAGTGGLTKVGTGVLTLTGTNTYTGPTTINGGVLNVSSDSGFGAAPAAPLGNALTINGGTLQYGSAFTINPNRDLLVGAGGVTFDTNTYSVAYAGGISGASTVTKNGTGTLVLSGGGNVNSYVFNGGELAESVEPGSTTSAYVFGGGVQLFLTSSSPHGSHPIILNATGGFDLPFVGTTLTDPDIISGTNSSFALTKIGAGNLILQAPNTFTGPTIISGGAFTIDLTASTTQVTGPATNILYNGVTPNTLTLGGVNVAVNGKAATINSQTLAGVILNAGADNFAITNNGSSNPVLLALGTISRSVGSTAGFTQPTVGTVSTTNGYTTSTQNTNGILGGYAAVGTEFAANSVSSGTGNIVALSTYGSLATDSGASTTNNDKVSATTVPITGSTTINSLNLQGGTTTAAAVTNSGTLTLLSGGLLADETGTSNVAHSISGGTLTVGSGNTANDLIATVVNGSSGTTTLTVSSVIADTTAGLSLTKGGLGTLKLTGTNIYTGATYLDAGILNVTADNNLGTAPGTATAASLTFNGGTLQFASSFNLNSNRGIAMLSNGATIDTNNFNSTYAGVVSGAAPLTKNGGGTLALTGTNTYTGITTINAGVLNVTSDSSLGAVPIVPTASQISFPANTSGTLQFGASTNLSSNRGITINGTGTIDTQAFNTIYAGTISGNGNMAKIGSGTLTLSGTNTYGGTTTVGVGTLLVNGTLAGVEPILVSSGATLGGIGTITNPGTISAVGTGTISAGSGSTVGMLTVTTGALTLAPTSVFNAVVNANGVAGINYSQLVNPGGITVGAGATFSVTTTGGTFANNSVLELITNDVTAGGTTNTFSNPTYTSGNYTFAADYTTNPGSFDVDVTVAVPEPSTWLAGVLMLGVVGCHQRRQIRRLAGGCKQLA